ncbi:MAG: hypothetical protein ACKVKT_07285 [Rhodospirillales bacterium]
MWSATGDTVGEPLLGHNGSANSILFSRDDSIIITGGYFDGQVRQWTLAKEPGAIPSLR